MENNYCVIMAGGDGNRFWPLSTDDSPKQFTDPLGLGYSFIRGAFDRMLSIVPVENFLVATTLAYKDKVLKHLPELDESQIVLEPVRRGTAPCIAYTAHRIFKMNPEARIVVAPSDHLITNELKFVEAVRCGLDFVGGSMNLLTIGVAPTRAETGYGYIQFDQDTEFTNIKTVKTFTEKPNREIAEAFVSSGEFLWNSGLFMWSARGIIAALDEFLPEVNKMFADGESYYQTSGESEFIKENYPKCDNISIDYGVMEKSGKVFVQKANFGWCDVGTWESLYRVTAKDENSNSVRGRVLTYNTKNSIINISDKKVALIDGLDGYVVAAKGDNLLICRVENERAIRNWVDDVKFKFGQDRI